MNYSFSVIQFFVSLLIRSQPGILTEQQIALFLPRIRIFKHEGSSIAFLLIPGLYQSEFLGQIHVFSGCPLFSPEEDFSYLSPPIYKCSIIPDKNDLVFFLDSLFANTSGDQMSVTGEIAATGEKVVFNYVSEDSLLLKYSRRGESPMKDKK